MSRATSRGTATVRQLCEAFGLSRQAYYVAGRVRQARCLRPAGRPSQWATTAQLQEAIRPVVADHPAWGVRKVWAILRRQDLVVSRKRVWAVMKAMGLTLPAPGQTDAPRRGGHVAVPESNRRWASDLTTVWTRQHGTVALVPVIDCGDRFALQCEVTKSQEAPAVLAPLARALAAQFGVPQQVPDGLELRTDHGPQYTGRDCEQLCEAWNVEHTFAPVRRPTGNAVAERFLLTLKLELIWTRDWDSLEELRTELARWLTLYNEHRPHQALGWRTPAEQRAANLGLHDSLGLAA